jgi:hypothetical protein
VDEPFVEIDAIAWTSWVAADTTSICVPPALSDTAAKSDDTYCPTRLSEVSVAPPLVSMANVPVFDVT